MELLRQLTRLLLPTRCALCQLIGPDTVCAACLTKLQPIPPQGCLRCGRLRRTRFASPDCGECHGETLGMRKARSAFVYTGPGRDLLAEFKFKRYLGAGESMLAAAAEHLPAEAAQLFAEPELRLDAVVPVPLHPARLRARKFNQSEFIARRIARRLDAPLRLDFLLRVRDTPTQVGLLATQRRENVRGAFAVPEGISLKGQAILVVDDLMTTGSTLRSCAAALRRAGCTQAYAFTVFSTHRDVETPDGGL